MLPAKKLSKYRIPLGQNTQTGNPLDLNAEWLRTGVHLVGPTGCGKTRYMAGIYTALTKIPNATIFVFSAAKRDLYDLCMRWSILHGLTSRLILFDMGDPEATIGYDRLKPNGQTVSSQVKFAREGFRDAWAQESFDQTLQLARLLFLSLFVSRTLEWGLAEALSLLNPGSATRKQALKRLPPSYMREALAYFDSLDERRQEQLAASTIARLEPFVSDPLIARTITQRDNSLDLAEVIRRHKILLVNLSFYQPLSPDDQRLLGRMLITDVLAHVFERTERDPDPVFLLIDEVEELATESLCRAFDLGRGLGLCTIIGHQHISQLVQEDKTGYLLQSVMNDARTKIVFGGNSVHDLEEHLVKELFIDQYDPWTIKQELTSLELDPIEETRQSITEARSHSRGRGVAFPFSVSKGESTTVTDGVTESESEGTQDGASYAKTAGTTRGISRERGTSETRTDSWAETDGESESWAETDADSENWSEMDGQGETSSETTSTSDSSGAGGSTDFGFTGGADGDLTRSYHLNTGWNAQSGSSASSGRSSSRSHSSARGGGSTHATTRGGSRMRAATKGGSVARGSSVSVGENYSESESETQGTSHSHNQEHGQAVSHSDSLTESKTVSRGRTPSFNEEESVSRSVTTAPFYAYRKRRNVTSREFLSKDDFLTLALQRLKGQPRGHFVIKVPGRAAVFAQAPFIKEPRITARQLARARERIFSQPYYTRIGDDERVAAPALIAQRPVPAAGENDTGSPASAVLQLEDQTHATTRIDNQRTIPESGSTIESRRAQLPVRAPRRQNHSSRRTRSQDS